MVAGDISKLLAVIVAAYPMHFRNRSEQDARDQLSAWYAVLGEYPYEVANAALRSYLASDTKGFPPVPGQIIDHIVRITRAETMPAMEAWTLVRKAARNGSYGAEEEFAKLPEDVQKVLGGPSAIRDMAMMSQTSIDVEQAHFLRQYSALQQRRDQEARLPSAVREVMRLARDSRKDRNLLTG